MLGHRDVDRGSAVQSSKPAATVLSALDLDASARLQIPRRAQSAARLPRAAAHAAARVGIGARHGAWALARAARRLGPASRDGLGGEADRRRGGGGRQGAVGHGQPRRGGAGAHRVRVDGGGALALAAVGLPARDPAGHAWQPRQREDPGEGPRAGAAPLRGRRGLRQDAAGTARGEHPASLAGVGTRVDRSASDSARAGRGAALPALSLGCVRHRGGVGAGVLGRGALLARELPVEPLAGAGDAQTELSGVDRHARWEREGGEDLRPGATVRGALPGVLREVLRRGPPARAPAGGLWPALRGAGARAVLPGLSRDGGPCRSGGHWAWGFDALPHRVQAGAGSVPERAGWGWRSV